MGELLSWVSTLAGSPPSVSAPDGAPLPRWPQVSPSESCRESQMKLEAQTHSSSRPSAGATAAPITETPVAEAPVAHSQSRRCESKPWLPFPLQDSEGRLASILQLYEHAAMQPATPHNVAGRAIMHLHPDLLLQKATCLGNQVACMIAEYHLTASARQSSLRPIIPEEVAPLLPPLKSYVPGVAFEGTQDVRVVDHAVALRVAIWLHRLNMVMGGEALASESL